MGFVVYNVQQNPVKLSRKSTCDQIDFVAFNESSLDHSRIWKKI